MDAICGGAFEKHEDIVGKDERANLMPYTLTVNGKSMTTDAAPDIPLLWVLRDSLGLHGTKYGCGVGQYGGALVPDPDHRGDTCSGDHNRRIVS